MRFATCRWHSGIRRRCFEGVLAASALAVLGVAVHPTRTEERRCWTIHLDRLRSLVPAPVEQHARKDASGFAAFVNPSEALMPVLGVLKKFFERVAPEEHPRAMLGLNALALSDLLDPTMRENAVHGSVAPADADELVADAQRYMRMATAAYGKLLLNPVAFPEKGLYSALQLRGETQTMMQEHAKLGDTANMLFCELKSSWLHPAHFVVYDADRREAIVVVRGTLSFEDIITDLGAEMVPFFRGGTAHSSILQSAANVLRSVAPTLDKLAPSVDRVTFTGHSLGGGVAAYMSLLFEELACEDATASRVPEVRCVAFGAPGVCTLDIARSLCHQMTSVCLGDDVVPRLSLGHVFDLHDDAMAVVRAAPDNCTDFLEGMRDVQRDLYADAEKTIRNPVAAVMGVLRGKSVPPLDSLRRCVKRPARTADGSETLGKADGSKNLGNEHDRLYPAGRNIHLSLDGTVRELDPQDLAPRITFSKFMLWHHLPMNYEAALDKSASQL